MIEIVVALLMIVNGEIKEHRIQESMPKCLKGKRIAMRSNSGTSVEYQCIKAKPCLLYTSPSPRDRTRSRMPSSA